MDRQHGVGPGAAKGHDDAASPMARDPQAMLRPAVAALERAKAKGFHADLLNGALTLACLWDELATMQGIGDDGDGHLRQ